MTDRRRVTLTAHELSAIQRGLEVRSGVCAFEISRAHDRKSRNFWATEYAHVIAAYRKTYAYPSGKGLVTQIADRHRAKMTHLLLEWDERHGA